MSSKAASVIVWCLLGPALVFSQAPPPAQNKPPEAETTAPAIPGVVAAGTKVRLIQQGQQGVQGAIALEDGTLLFTERGGSRITKMDTNGNFSTYLANTTEVNSATIDPKGRVIGVRFKPADVAVLAPALSVLAPNFEGRPFGRPNDILVDRKGGVYWTDDLGLPEQNIKSAVYYVRPTGELIKVTDEVAKPNGIVLSPDDKILYVGDGNGMFLVAFDVQPDGSLRNKRNSGRLEGGRTGVYPKDPFGRQAEDGLATVADGLAIDTAGRVYVTSSIGIQVISPAGQHLGTIPSSRPLQNIAFAGRDRKTLYGFGGGNMYEIQMLAEGVRGRPK